MKWFATSRLFDFPLFITVLLVAVNTINFLLCLKVGGNGTVPVEVLAAKGALTASATHPGQYWRLIAYGFLFANGVTLAMSVFSLLICGPFVERRLGPSVLLVVYLAALAGGGLVSVLAHAVPFMTIGPSGAIFGMIGALFALWILGSKEVSPTFFLANFTVNLAFASRSPAIDWAVHIGGFVTGMLSVAVLSLVAKTNVYWLRCKFPEFVKLNIVVLAMFGGAYIYQNPPIMQLDVDERLIAVAEWSVALLVLIKAMDLLLAVRHGLIGVVVGLAALNGAAVLIAYDRLHQRLINYCWPGPFASAWTERAVHLLCLDPDTARHAVASCTFVLTLVVYIYPLQRGIRDVGFVGATYVAERRRQRSL